MPRLARSAGSFPPSSAPFARNVCWNRLPWPVGRGAPALSVLPGRRPPRSFEYDAGARARGLYVDLGNRGSIVAHCAAIRHNAGGQLSPAVQSASEARLDGVLSVRLFSAPFLSDFCAKTSARVTLRWSSVRPAVPARVTCVSPF